MNKIKYYILAILLLPAFYGLNAASDEDIALKGSKHFRLRYVINIEKLDSSFVDNAERMETIEEFLTGVRDDSLLNITAVDFKGTASPDGAYDFNVWLSENRLRTFKELINSYIDLPDSVIRANVTDIPWDEFRESVATSNIPKREEVLAVIDEGPRLVPYFNNRRIDARLLKLKAMDRGAVWETLKKPILFDLRYGDAVFYYQSLLPFETASYLNTLVSDLKIPEFLPVPEQPELCEWMPRFYIKSNLLGWAVAQANLAIEFDFAPHWSFAFPIYYSCWDYIKSTIKFRTLTYQPELRYWPRWGCGKGNEGFFVGAHFGLSYYNYAFDGKERWQDRDGKTPAIGGGVAIGFRMPISRNKRWRMEFTAGAGVYPLDYDVFENTPNYKDGPLIDRRKKTYIGLDQLAVTFSYSFDMKKYARRYPVKGGAL